ncbi:hypothetical protein Avbf_02789 [Armadillidium vulgare]|nr:hypothetical protein Avbf_02789 [Armadillidium vulgare]
MINPILQPKFIQIPHLLISLQTHLHLHKVQHMLELLQAPLLTFIPLHNLLWCHSYCDSTSESC